MFRFCDEANGGGGYMCFMSHLFGERHLITGHSGYVGGGDIAAGRGIDQINAVLFEFAGNLDGIGNGEAALCPIAGGEAHKEGQLFRPDLAYRVRRLNQEAHTVRKWAAIGVVAVVGER